MWLIISDIIAYINYIISQEHIHYIFALTVGISSEYERIIIIIENHPGIGIAGCSYKYNNGLRIELCGTPIIFGLRSVFSNLLHYNPLHTVAYL